MKHFEIEGIKHAIAFNFNVIVDFENETGADALSIFLNGGQEGMKIGQIRDLLYLMFIEGAAIEGKEFPYSKRELFRKIPFESFQDLMDNVTSSIQVESEKN